MMGGAPQPPVESKQRPSSSPISRAGPKVSCSAEATSCATTGPVAATIAKAVNVRTARVAGFTSR